MKVVGNAKFNALTKSGPSTGAYRHKTAVDCTPNDGAVAASQVATFDPGFEAGVGVGVQQHVDCTPAGTVLKVPWTPFAGGRTGFGGTFAYPATQGSFLIEGCVGTSPLLHLQSGVEYTFDQSDVSNWYHPFEFLGDWLGVPNGGAGNGGHFALGLGAHNQEHAPYWDDIEDR